MALMKICIFKAKGKDGCNSEFEINSIESPINQYSLNIFRGVAKVVSRQFRVSITVLGVEFSRRAENP